MWPFLYKRRDFFLEQAINSSRKLSITSFDKDDMDQSVNTSGLMYHLLSFSRCGSDSKDI